MFFSISWLIALGLVLRLNVVVSATIVDEYHQHLLNYVDNGTPLPESMILVGHRSVTPGIAEQYNAAKTLLWQYHPHLEEDYGTGVYMSQSREGYTTQEEFFYLWFCLVAADRGRYFDAVKAWIPSDIDANDFPNIHPSDDQDTDIDGMVELIYHPELIDQYISEKYQLIPSSIIRLAELVEDAGYQMVIPPKLLNDRFVDDGMRLVTVCRANVAEIPNVKIDWEYLPNTYGAPSYHCPYYS